MTIREPHLHVARGRVGPAIALVLGLGLVAGPGVTRCWCDEVPGALPAGDAATARSPVTDPAEARTDAPATGGVEAGDQPAQPETIDLSAASAASGETSSATTQAEGQDTVQQLAAGTGVRVALICTNCNTASLTVNGLTGGEHVRVLVDGVPVAGGLATSYILTQFPTELVGHTHVARGPGSALSGPGAVGGELQFFTAPRDDRRAFLSAEVGDWGRQTLKLAGGDRWGPVGALVFLEGAVGNWVDGNRDGYHDLPAFERVAEHGIFDFHLTDRQVLTVSALYYGESQSEGPGAPIWHQNFRDPEQSWGEYLHEDVSLGWRQFGLQWERTSPSGVRLSWSARHALRRQKQWSAPYPGVDPSWAFIIEDERIHTSFQAEAPVGQAGFLTGGLTWSKQRLPVRQSRDPLNPLFVVDGLDHWEGYLQYDRSAGSHWDWSVGARYDALDVFGRSVELDLLTRELVHETAADSLAEMGLSSDRLTNSYFLPRAQAHFRPSAKLVLGLSAGRGIVGPTPVFEKTCCGAAYKRSIELVPERAWSYQGTVEWHPTLDMRLTTTLFWTDFTNYQERAVDQSAVNLYVPKYQNKNIPTARVRGMDVVHDMRFRDDVYNVGWTYTYSDPEDDHGKPLRFLSRHEASAYFRYNEREHGTSVSLDVRYVGPQSHYLLTETRLPADSPPEYVDSDGYVTADVRVEQRLGKKGWSVFGGASNLTDYVQSDLGEFWRCYDWGPLQGRYAFVGAKLNR